MMAGVGRVRRVARVMTPTYWRARKKAREIGCTLGQAYTLVRR